jgi:hypothetical protein
MSRPAIDPYSVNTDRLESTRAFGTGRDAYSVHTTNFMKGEQKHAVPFCELSYRKDTGESSTETTETSPSSRRERSFNKMRGNW